ARIDARAAAVDEPHHRVAAGERHRAQARHLLFALLADAAALDGEVVRRRAHETPVDAAEARDHRVRGRAIVALRSGGEPHPGAVRPDLEVEAVVEEAPEPLAAGELVATVLLRDLLLAAHLAHARAAFFEVLDHSAEKRLLGHEAAPFPGKNPGR